MSEPGGARPPAAALVLGLSGLLPLAGVIVIELMIRHGQDREPSGFIIAMPALVYAALILSFIGGMWWSAACNRAEGTLLWRWLGIAVLTSLWAAASFWMGFPRGTATMLAAGLVLALIADWAAVITGLVPPWWMRLRVPLSIGLGLETIMVGWLA